jgi:predicted AlkP superfamily phosphohydrolase/phosphomutase
VAVRDYERLREYLVERLLSWRDPLHDAPVVRRVWRREELYAGPYVGLAPDLVLELNTPNGYTYVGLPSYGTAGPAIEALDPVTLGGKLAGMSGSHRADGLFALRAEGVRPGSLAGARIVDLAPTILALCGVAGGEDWDGRCLPVVTRPDTPGPACELPAAEIEYGAAETLELERRLAQLGYLA